mmetsp:Transcript_114804/g.319768  ORF Transcript_114804/g.319768 Transcript_114804/m.319768 type:complete len:209 (-) Transcript_114804:348-974(-)
MCSGGIDVGCGRRVVQALERHAHVNRWKLRSRARPFGAALRKDRDGTHSAGRHHALHPGSHPGRRSSWAARDFHRGRQGCLPAAEHDRGPAEVRPARLLRHWAGDPLLRTPGRCRNTVHVARRRHGDLRCSCEQHPRSLGIHRSRVGRHPNTLPLHEQDPSAAGNTREHDAGEAEGHCHLQLPRRDGGHLRGKDGRANRQRARRMQLA